MKIGHALSALILTATTACSSRQPVPLDFISSASPSSIQVFDGYRVLDILGPSLAGDTVRGVVNGADFSMPVRRVQGLTAVKFSSGRTALLIGGIAALGGVMAYAVASQQGSAETECEYGNPSFLSDLCTINR